MDGHPLDGYPLDCVYGEKEIQGVKAGEIESEAADEDDAATPNRNRRVYRTEQNRTE
jgi:hypothetical protein